MGCLGGKVLVAFGSRVPAGILHEGVVGPQVCGHPPAAAGATGHEFGRDMPVVLLGDHGHHLVVIVVGGLVAGGGALP